MPKNMWLEIAKRSGKDDFTVEYDVVADEMKHYGDAFRGKTILCNCNDVDLEHGGYDFHKYHGFRKYSYIYKYFWMRFKALGLKKLIAVHYEPSEYSNHQMTLDGTDTTKHSYYIETTSDDVTGNSGGGHGRVVELKGNGSFDSPECIRLLEEADIVISNPPPKGKFRKYLSLLVRHDKKFITICNINQLTSEPLFSLVKEHKVWCGATMRNKTTFFSVPDYYPTNSQRHYIDDAGVLHLEIKELFWLTNMEHDSMWSEPLMLNNTYNPGQYPRYTDVKCEPIIYVKSPKEIPNDYYGLMGVPLSFYTKYNPEQFEILGYTGSKRHNGYCKDCVEGMGNQYKRLVVRRRCGNKRHTLLESTIDANINIYP